MGEEFPQYALTLEKHDIKPGLALITFSTFDNDKAGIAFIKKVKSAAAKALPWIPAKKYYYLIMADDVLITLKENKDINSYRKLLHKKYPADF